MGVCARACKCASACVCASMYVIICTVLRASVSYLDIYLKSKISTYSVFFFFFYFDI